MPLRLDQLGEDLGHWPIRHDDANLFGSDQRDSYKRLFFLGLAKALGARPNGLRIVFLRLPSHGVAESIRPLPLLAHGISISLCGGTSLGNLGALRYRGFAPKATSAATAFSRTWFASSSVKFSPSFRS